MYKNIYQNYIMSSTMFIKVVMSSTMFIKVVSDLYNKHKSKWRSLIFQLTCFFPV